MLNFNNNKWFIHRKLILYAKRPSLKNGLFDHYIQAISKEKILGFKRVPKYTKLIDLSNNYFNEFFDKNTIYEIRRAKKEGVFCKTSYNISEFTTFYNQFTHAKKIDGILSESELAKYGDSLVLRSALSEELNILVYHSYLVDWSIKRVRLLNSASNIYLKSINSAEKAHIGRANRLLHYEDMIFFKESGCQLYDFGGYSMNTSDRSLIGINSFKDGFGGTLIEESNYVSYCQHITNRILIFLKKILKSSRK